MISPVGESAQVALQASTIGPSPQAVATARVDNKAAEKSTEAIGAGKGRGDTVTISAEAKQLTSAALNATDESQESPKEKSQDESPRKR